MDEQNELIEQRKQKLAQLRAAGRDPFVETEFARTHLACEIQHNFDTLDGKAVSIAGRLMAKRGMGKASFADLHDASGKIQLSATVDKLADEYEQFLHLDLGDIIGVNGTVFRTRRGEISVSVDQDRKSVV